VFAGLDEDELDDLAVALDCIDTNLRRPPADRPT
jgi:hypothetical protein